MTTFDSANGLGYSGRLNWHNQLQSTYQNPFQQQGDYLKSINESKTGCSPFQDGDARLLLTTRGGNNE